MYSLSSSGGRAAHAGRPLPRRCLARALSTPTPTPLRPPSVARGPRRWRGAAAAGSSSDGSSSKDDDDDDAPPVPLGDWRAFRAKLVSSGVASTEDAEASVGGGASSIGGGGGGDGADSDGATSGPGLNRGRPSPENQRLLRTQNPKLAEEEHWVHRIGRPERGCLLVATHDAPHILGNENYWQAVVLIVDVTAAGSVGLLLNRPTSMALARRPGGLPFEVSGAPEGMQNGFGDNRVYRGGPVAQQVLHLLHGHKLEGAQELVPGVFVGGEKAATQAVLKGELDPSTFKFLAGAMLWETGAVERECAQGAWLPVAASRPLILKQVLQLPVPLWREVLQLLGDAEAVRQVRAAYSEDGPDD